MGTPCHPTQQEEEGSRVGMEPGTAVDRTFYPLAPGYHCGFPSCCCHFACVTQAVSVIITRRRSCNQVYDIHGLLHPCYILRACKQHLVALSDKSNVSPSRDWRGALCPRRGEWVTHHLGCYRALRGALRAKCSGRDKK